MSACDRCGAPAVYEGIAGATGFRFRSCDRCLSLLASVMSVSTIELDDDS